ncbi:MAG: Gfo/Idh/MocA family oxidoreductase [Sedimentisphaerales bacterium]|nr:Gfo/Idh/MocA family oxidoreductase [Sedimentisphaerales bacterium]
MNSRKPDLSLSRRHFLQSSAVAGLAAVASRIPGAYAQASDTLRIGVIGAGGRGTGAALNCLEAADGVKLVALADLFPDRVDGAMNKFREQLKERTDQLVDIPAGRRFTGFDAYKQLLALDDVDLVILATPPHFRPQHFAAAVEAGKHVFMEKPVAVDPVGVRTVIAAAKVADDKSLSVVAGTQRRHQNHYLDIMKRIHDGAIGDLVGGQVYWMQGALWSHERRPEWTDMEYYLRNWLYHTWLSGDHIVEQHLHNLDVMNWAFGALPESAVAMGGRQVRTAEIFGNAFDHFAVEYQFSDSIRVESKCRQIAGCADRVSEHIVGTKGAAYFDSRTAFISGENEYKYDGPDPNPYVQEHADLIAAIRSGRPVNEAVQVAESTLTAILGRMSAYTGREISWKWIRERSQLALGPKTYQFGPLPVDPIAVPGQTELV